MVTTLSVGGSGDDYLNGGAGADNIKGGSGAHDRVSYAYLTLTDAGIDQGVSINLGTSVFLSITGLTAKSGALQVVDTLSGIEDVTGSSFNDVIVGNSAANSLLGGSGGTRFTAPGAPIF